MPTRTVIPQSSRRGATLSDNCFATHPPAPPPPTGGGGRGGTFPRSLIEPFEGFGKGGRVVDVSAGPGHVGGHRLDAQGADGELVAPPLPPQAGEARLD